MGNFNRDRGSRPRRDFAGRDSGRQGYGGQGRGPREMYKTVCSNCGKDCEVPFRPTGEKPVYCSECFEKKGGREGSGVFQDRNLRRPNYEVRNEARQQSGGQLEVIGRKLDKIIDLLTKISSPNQNVEPKQSEEPLKSDIKVEKVESVKIHKAKTSKKKTI